MDVDRARVAIRGVAPERLEQRLSREDSARSRRESPQQLELDVREGDLAAPQLHGAAAEVDREPVRLDSLRLASTLRGLRSASEECADTAPELVDRERLRDVVVGAELETAHLVVLVAERRQHDDRHRAVRANALEHVHSVQLRQHDVEDHEVDGTLVETPQRVFAVARLDDAEAVPLEGIRQELLNSVLVVNEENGGRIRHTSPRRLAAPPSYYSPGMAAPPRRGEPQRRRRGSLERPVNGRLYRGAWSLVALPLLVAAFSVSRPAPFPAPTVPPPSFDSANALRLAEELSTLHPNRAPGSAGARGAARWIAGQLRSYGFGVELDRFRATIPGHGDVPLVNVVAVSPGRSRRVLVVMAHRDDPGTGAGANDNASGTAALLEIARAYAPLATDGGARVSPLHTLVFLSSDGGAFGGVGAARFAASSLYRRRIAAVVNLDSIGRRARPRLQISADAPRSPPGVLVATARARLLENALAEADPPSAPRQPLDLAQPFSVY